MIAKQYGCWSLFLSLIRIYMGPESSCWPNKERGDWFMFASLICTIMRPESSCRPNKEQVLIKHGIYAIWSLFLSARTLWDPNNMRFVSISILDLYRHGDRNRHVTEPRRILLCANLFPYSYHHGARSHHETEWRSSLIRHARAILCGKQESNI